MAAPSFAADFTLSAGLTSANIAGHQDRGARVALAYEFNPVLSAEVAVLHSADFQTVETDSMDLAAIASYPVGYGIMVTGKLGLSRTFAEIARDTTAAWSPVYGIGANYKIDKNWGVSLNADRYGDFAYSGRAMNVVSLSATYGF